MSMYVVRPFVRSFVCLFCTQSIGQWFFFVWERVGVAAGVGKSSKGASAMVRLAESLRVVNGKLSGEW